MMIIPQGKSNFSAATQLITQTGVETSEVNQPRNETWVHIYDQSFCNDNDCHKKYDKVKDENSDDAFKSK